MSNFLFHNKFHRANHHTIATPGLPDSATDPIASQSEPFLGIFYNYQNPLLNLSAIDVSYLETFFTDSITTFDGLSVNTIRSIYAAITANVFTSSQQWFEMHTNINGFSAVYGLYPTVSSTVNSFSGVWNLAYDFYSSLNTLSTNYFSTYTVTNSYSGNWPFIDTTLRLNLVQQNSYAKNFSGANITDITVLGSNISAYWNLSAAQCAFFRITGDTVFKNIVNPLNKKKGGEYTLILQQDGFGSRSVAFENDYVFSYTLSTYSLSSQKGFLYSTGSNTNGALALNSFTNKNVFTSISSVSAADFTNSWTNIVAINTAVIAFSGKRIFTAGANFNGQLGQGDTVSRNVFTPLSGEWDDAKSGSNHFVALSAGTNKWYGTGSSLQGQLGLNVSTNIYRLTPLSGNWNKLVCNGNFIYALSAGTSRWYGTGTNTSGELGIYNVSNQLSFTPLTGNWDKIVAGTAFVYALSAGTKQWYATGNNTDGQLSLGTLANTNRFVPITGEWDDVICGSVYAFAVSGGSWYAVGSNSTGNLGLGDNARRTRFTPLTGNWTRIIPGRGSTPHTFALSSNGVWHATGYNTEGQLGLGNTTNKNVFTPVTGNWSKISLGSASTYALITAVEVNYNNTYLPRTEFVAPTALSVTVIRFTCDGNKLYGKPTFYYYERDTIWTYFAGDGLIFDPDPAEFYINDYFIPIQGLTVAGVVVPAAGYTDGGGILVVEGLPS